jgi:hypothetical protein
MSEAYEINMGHSIEAKRKYNYFFIGLTFSILALAINHKVDTKAIFPVITELLGWLCLIISGFSGLWRLEWDGVVFELAAELAKAIGFKRQILEAKHTGRPMLSQETGEALNLDEQAEIYENNIVGIEKRLKEIDSKFRCIYDVQKWSFLVGVLILVVAYGYEKTRFMIQ